MIINTIDYQDLQFQTYLNHPTSKYHSLFELKL